MSYRIYIRNDYRPAIRWYPDLPWYKRKTIWIVGFLVSCLASIYYLTTISNRSFNETLRFTSDDTVLSNLGSPVTRTSHQPAAGLENNVGYREVWQTITVKSGENLSIIFDRLHLSPNVLSKVASLGKETAAFQRLNPGDQLHFKLANGELQALKFEPDLTTTLLVTAENGNYRSKTVVTELETRVHVTTGVVRDSLFQAGVDAGLSDNLIMRFASIYAWDIDFALELRAGDYFKIVYEEHYKEGRKVGEGPILVTEFNNRGKNYKAARYVSPEGEAGFYNEQGYSMRKAFLRTPLKFNRISSRFSLSRKHPILNRIRAHRGVDYAAPSGTPVKATGDGTVVSIGRNGGYGNTIVLRHAGVYQTVYAHLLGYARGLKRGVHVEQGEVIGYVGKTGLATGPHLHYEFRVNGVHKDPLTVDLPKALRLMDQQIAHFHQQTKPLFARLDDIPQKDFALVDTRERAGMVLALEEVSNAELPVQ
jgi:murein DD-endopeptidase MepM/ murein hydrolase activator NlpD